MPRLPDQVRTHSPGVREKPTNQPAYRVAEGDDMNTVTVPVEPTDEMALAGAARLRDFLSEPGPYPRAKAMYKAMIAAAPPSESGWRDISTAPKDGETVLLAAYTGDPFGWVVGYGYYCHHDGIAHGWISRGFTEPPGNLALGNPELWQPLPEPPKEQP